jgi:dethiobiotin synthetase/adenosylmethionine--8-amino-7-oxononanoate aminotransferase
MFDACASSQGVGRGESSMSLAVAAAAGRYGHISHPNIIHAPAIELSKKLLQGQAWAKRVLFADNENKAMEAAIKMGMKLYQARHRTEDDPDVKWALCVQQDYYRGSMLDGVFLETPTLGFRDGVLQVSLSDAHETFESIDQAMDVETRLSDNLYTHYVDTIITAWNDYENRPVDEESGSFKRKIIASVVLEPILMSAGGIKFVDPLWQRALVDVARSKDVPVIFDESASGLYRVGVQSCREILKVDPDVATYSRLLTGGLLPMTVTLATEEIFKAFSGEAEELLHGHSYATHPMGCVSAIHALESYDAVLENGKLCLFAEEQTRSLSKLPLVQQSFSLGTVLAIAIEPEDGSSGCEASSTSRSVTIVRELIQEGLYVRSLGNVIYILASPLANTAECARVCDVLHRTIQRFGDEIEK